MWSSRQDIYTRERRPAKARLWFCGGAPCSALVLALLALLCSARAWAWQPSLDEGQDLQELTLLWDQAQEAMGENNYSKADKLLRKYVALAPDDKAAFRDLARVLSWQRRYDESIKYYDIYLDRISYDVDVAVERARVKAWMLKYPEAEADVRTILAREPENIDANLLLAGLLEWQGKKKEAETQYRWVLKLDPTNATALKGSQSERPEPGDGVAIQLEAGLDYTQDNHEFFMVGARLGLRFFPVPRFSLMPFLGSVLIDDEFTDMLYGVGGGLQATLELVRTVELTGEMSALVFPQADSLVDWGGLIEAGWTPNTVFNFKLGFDSYLYGPIGQSSRALEEKLRYYRITAGTDVTYRRFVGSAQAAWSFLPLSPLVDDTDIITTLNLYPRFRLVGKDQRFFVGTKHWYNAHTNTAPTNPDSGGALFWDPAQYFTHQAALRLEGKLGKKNSYYLEGSGGFGHEFIPGDDTLAQPVDDDWIFFPVAGGAAGIERQWSDRLTTSAGTWLSYSHRDSADYLLWNVTLNLVYRF